MFDFIHDSRARAAVGVAALGGTTRTSVVLYILDKQRATADEWVQGPYRDAALRGGGSEGGTYKALRWLVDHRVLLRSPRREGRGGARLYKVNPRVEGWLVPWSRPPEIRRLILDAAEAEGRAAYDELLAALERGTSPWDDAPRRPQRGKNVVPHAEVPRHRGQSAAKNPPKSRAPARQRSRGSSLEGRPEERGGAPPASRGGAGANFDESQPGGKAVMQAVRKALHNNRARAYGWPADLLQQLLDAHGPDVLVEAIGLALFEGGVPQLVGALDEAVEWAATPLEDRAALESWGAPKPVSGCPDCGGTGWVSVEEDGRHAAARCPCLSHGVGGGCEDGAEEETA